MNEQALAVTATSLTRLRRRATYNAAEQAFSQVLQQRLQLLLEGKCNALELLRRYPTQSGRLGVMITPPAIPREQLRLRVVEDLLWEAIAFFRSDAVGGPISQEEAADGSVLEHQVFSTRYPHIVIERIDRYVGDDGEPLEITWRLQRVQNQRSQTQVNRLLDAANLAMELLRAVR